MWFPFVVVYAVHDWFTLGIAAATLATIYQYLTARSFLEFSSRDAFQYAAGEVAVQVLLFSLLAQVWLGGMELANIPMELRCHDGVNRSCFGGDLSALDQLDIQAKFSGGVHEARDPTR
jgi:hypothetical protein